LDDTVGEEDYERAVSISKQVVEWVEGHLDVES
jgi:hypothetical protein